VVARQGQPTLLAGSHVTSEFFDALGTEAAAGRQFSGSRDGTPGELKVVLSHDGARQLYGGSEQAVGQRLRVNGEAHTVVGVMPPHTEWPDHMDLWVLSQREVPPAPVDLDQPADNRDVQYFDGIARLKPGVSIEQAQQDMNRVAAIIQARHRPTDARREIRLRSIREEIVGGIGQFGSISQALVVLQAAVGLVLLIACANVSSLLIARAAGRRRELAIRGALGAGRGRLVRQLLTESLFLGAIGGAVGLLVGSWLVVLLLRVLPSGVPRSDEIALDRIVAMVTVLVALGAGVLFGVLPALQGSRADSPMALKEGGRGSTGGARTLGRSALVVAQVALTLVLLVGAGLMLNSLLRLQRVDSGFRPENVTIVPLALPQSVYSTKDSQVALYRRFLDGLSQRGDVQAAAIGFPAPLRGDNASGHFFIEGRSTSDPADRPFANIGSVSREFFAAMGIPLLAGRTFAEHYAPKAPGEVIVSSALARKYWQGESPIGKRLRFENDPDEPWITVIGVVGDTRQLGLKKDPPPILYFSYHTFTLPFTNILVRSTSTHSSITSLVRSQLVALDPDLPGGDSTTLQSVIDRSVAQPRFQTALLGAFAVVALVLAAVGVYGLISYSVTQRTREIGIRVALGARPAQVLVPVVREGLVLALLGVGIGLLAALAASRALSGFLFDVRPTDPLTFATVATVLLAVAFAASYIPSRRALRVDPITALRAE
jgi:putative ABC transport system permease protein